MRSEVLLVILLVIFYTSVESKRILAVFPVPSISHQVVFRPLIQELARRGHEIVVITTDPVFPKGNAPGNLTEIDVHDFSYETWQNLIKSLDGVSTHWSTSIEVAFSLVTKIFEEQTKTEHVQRVLQYESKYFDLLLLEACVNVALGLSHVFKAPVVQISSLGSPMNNYEIIGAPIHPLLYPNIIRDRIYNLTTWEKITQLWKEFQYYRLLKNIEHNDNMALRRIFGQQVPSLNELQNNVEMLLLNIYSIWDNNRPVPPSVIFMGGLHQNPVKELPENLKTYLDSSKHGVIYLSFGTNFKPSQIPTEKIQLFINVFSRLPYDVLWKWDLDELPGRSNNIRISKWLPQSDLLRHPKVRLFITQGGLQSTDEAITAGVPIIGIPMLGDQFYNVEKYVYHKIGLKLDMEYLTEKKLEITIQTVIEDQSYRQNIIRLRNLMQDQPQAPLERAVWWVEYVLRHGNAKHLRSPAANMPWTEYLELELVVTLIIFILIFLLFLNTSVKLIWNKFNSTTDLKNKYA